MVAKERRGKVRETGRRQEGEGRRQEGEGKRESEEGERERDWESEEGERERGEKTEICKGRVQLGDMVIDRSRGQTPYISGTRSNISWRSVQDEIVRYHTLGESLLGTP